MTFTGGSTAFDVHTGYTHDSFDKCEKCGCSDIYTAWNPVYECSDCGFNKPESHVSFGFYLKIPNYRSLTKSHSAEKLVFADGQSIAKRLEHAVTFRHNGTRYVSPRIAKEKWDLWIKENKIEIVRLAAIADTHILGSDPKMDKSHDPMIFLPGAIQEQRGIFLSIISMKTNAGTSKKKKQKIGNAINFILRNVKFSYWIGGTHPGHPIAKTLESANIRMNNTHKSFFRYRPFEEYIKTYSSIEKLRESYYAPMYITGPSIYDCIKHGFTQEALDEYVDKFLTSWDNSLSEISKIRVILNTGNTGIDTSVIRWAVKNERYVVVVNLDQTIYLYEDNKVYADQTNSYTIKRLLTGAT